MLRGIANCSGGGMTHGWMYKLVKEFCSRDHQSPDEALHHGPSRQLLRPSAKFSVQRWYPAILAWHTIMSSEDPKNAKMFWEVPSTPKCLQYKKARNWFRKNCKTFIPALIQKLATLVWFLCNIHATPRKAHGSYKKISVPQRIPVKITKKNTKKNREGN